MTLHDVLAASDLSIDSVPALRAAERVALRTGAELAVIHAYRPTALDKIRAAAAARDVGESTDRQARDALDEQLRAHLTRPDDVFANLRRHHDAAEAVIHFADARGADLVVCGLGEHSSLIDRIGQSVVLRLVHEAHQPVLVVPRAAILGEELPRQIFAAVDLEGPHGQVMRRAYAFSRLFEARVRFVSVVARPGDAGAARAALSSALQEQRVEGDLQVIVHETPADALTSLVAAEPEPLWLAVGTDRPSRLDCLTLRATSIRLLRTSERPLLTFPTRPARAHR